jgi:hypothetical protein
MSHKGLMGAIDRAAAGFRSPAPSIMHATAITDTLSSLRDAFNHTDLHREEFRHGPLLLRRVGGLFAF